MEFYWEIWYNTEFWWFLVLVAKLELKYMFFELGIDLLVKQHAIG